VPDQSVLIIGGSGFIGRALARHLNKRKQLVRVLGRRSPPLDQTQLDVEYHQGSLNDLKLLRTLLKDVQWVIHLASDSVPGSSIGPVAEGLSNIMPGLGLLEVMSEFPKARLMFVSTGGAMYGHTVGRAATEDTRIAPLSYYAAGKAALEAFIHAYSHQHALESVILRPANVYGPGQPVRAGFGIVPALFSAVAEDQPFEVWGDGEAIRDFLYISDFVELCGRLIDRPARSGLTLLNAGSGGGCSINDLCQLVERVTGRILRRCFRPSRKADVDYIVLDNSAVQKETGWSPSIDLQGGLARTWKWFIEGRR
jgi:UDP-glucose 4-epimerase